MTDLNQHPIEPALQLLPPVFNLALLTPETQPWGYNDALSRYSTWVSAFPVLKNAITIGPSQFHPSIPSHPRHTPAGEARIAAQRDRIVYIGPRECLLTAEGAQPRTRATVASFSSSPLSSKSSANPRSGFTEAPAASALPRLGSPDRYSLLPRRGDSAQSSSAEPAPGRGEACSP